MNIKDAQAQNVWSIFRQISQVPRTSKHEQQICLWLEEFAKNNNLAHRTDSAGNIVIELPATAGFEDSAAIVIQGHVDMVGVKDAESTHDFLKDPIKIIEKDDGWLYADGTTLGADNGLGISLGLALALEKEPAHPKIELLFTVDEETGLTGANALQEGFITGRRLLNVDSEEDSFTAGCAGGKTTYTTVELQFDAVPAEFSPYILAVSGLKGGHSGISIHEQRANAIKLLTRTINALMQEFTLGIADIQGGTVHNAIPCDAQATICFDQANLEKAKKIIDSLVPSLKREFSTTDGDLTVQLNPHSQSDCSRVFAADIGAKVINLLMALPHGVHRFSRRFEGLVETSNNLAVVKTNTSENTLQIVTSQRSSEESNLQYITGRIIAAANLAGAKVKSSQGYPGWQPDMDSPLLAQCKKVYAELRGKEVHVEVVHAGLECGIIGKKFEGMDMISFGPTIQGAHSVTERVNIESVDNVWKFLLKLLATLK